MEGKEKGSYLRLIPGLPGIDRHADAIGIEW
jgi:hypothetical protein